MQELTSSINGSYTLKIEVVINVATDYHSMAPGSESLIQNV